VPALSADRLLSFSGNIFTSKAIAQAIIDNPKESRKEFLLEQFIKAGNKSSNVNKYQFWQHDNHPIELWSNKVIDEKINYLPVRSGGHPSKPG